MKINWIEYENTDTGLKIERLFLNDLTLLVGLTGSGKTTILRAIQLFSSILDKDYKKDMINTTLNIEFEIENNKYEWYISFVNKFLKEESERPTNKIGLMDGYNLNISGEHLLENNLVHFKRKDNTIDYKGNTISGLSQTISCFNLFEDDIVVKKILVAFQKIIIYPVNIISPEKVLPSLTLSNLNIYKKNKEITCKVLSENNHALFKLCLLYLTKKDIFDEIEKAYSSIFKSVESLSFELDENSNTYMLFQKEKNVNHPIKCYYLASGMYKTLLLLTDLHCCSDGSIFSIDEFENSFGANCINDVMDIVESNKDKFQFIITSHHPYIINNISTNYWSILSRNGSIITAKSAKDFGITSTKHDAFFELLNIWEYEENLI